jgi:hypothetical protein
LSEYDDRLDERDFRAQPKHSRTHPADLPPKSEYGYAPNGMKLHAPKGWRILPEGSEIPQVHREFTTMWCGPRRCHSTMTPPTAKISGGVRAFAVPTEE